MKAVNVNGQSYTVADVRTMLLTNDKMILRGAILINTRQTNDEQKVKQTIYKNRRGFRSSDAIFTKYVEYYQRFGTMPEPWMNTQIGRAHV